MSALFDKITQYLSHKTISTVTIRKMIQRYYSKHWLVFSLGFSFFSRSGAYCKYSSKDVKKVLIVNSLTVFFLYNIIINILSCILFN